MAACFTAGQSRRSLQRPKRLALALLIGAFHGYGQVEYDPGWQHVADWHAWIDQDARAIVTSAQRAKFLALKTDDERRQFARQVWSENNPGSHYERLAYADRKFASGDVKGSQTDRGLVYIRFGPPDSVTPYEHSESWSWRSLIGVTFDKTQTGEYRIELFGGVQRRPWDIDLGPGCCGIKSAPLPEPLNEFGGGPPPKECRCEGFRRSPETQIRAKLQPGMETSMFPVTKAVTRIIILTGPPVRPCQAERPRFSINGDLTAIATKPYSKDN